MKDQKDSHYQEVKRGRLKQSIWTCDVDEFERRIGFIGMKWLYYMHHPNELEGEGEEIKGKWRALFENYLQIKAISPISLFKPNIAQAKLLYSENDHGEMPRTLMLEGSNKVGKTCFLSIRNVALSCGYYPWLQDIRHYSDNPLGRLWQNMAYDLGFKGGIPEIQEKFFWVNIKGFKVPNAGLVLGETYTESIDKKLVPEHLNWIPKDWLPKTKKNQQGVINRIEYEAGPAKGSMIHFRSYNSSADEFEGIDQSWVGYDEPPPEDIYLAVERGNIVADARSAFSFTALKEPWIYLNLVNKAKYHWI